MCWQHSKEIIDIVTWWRDCKRVLDDDRIYWTLWNSAWLHFTFYYCTHTHSVHSHVFTSRCSVAASNGGRSPYSGLPNCPRPQLPASRSNSSQRPNLSSPPNSLTHKTTTRHSSDWTAYNISARIVQKTPFLIVWAQLLFWEHVCLRGSNCCCIFAYLAVVAQQRVYMPQLSTVICDVTPCTPLEVHQHFGGTYCFHLHVRSNAKQATNKKEATAGMVLLNVRLLVSDYTVWHSRR
jgi:hypothetical protein